MDTDNITLVSSTDTDDEVQAALTGTADREVPEREDAQPVEQGEGLAVPLPMPAPKLDDMKADGSPMFANYEDWMAAHAQWTIDEAERRQIARESVRAINSRHITNIEQFKKTHADFDRAVEDVKDVVRDLVQELGPRALNVIDQYTTVDADNGPAIIYHLAKHPDELERIAKLSIPMQLAALGKLDARLGTRRGTATPASEPRVAARRTAAAPSAADEDDGEDYRAYATRRNTEERAGRR